MSQPRKNHHYKPPRALTLAIATLTASLMATACQPTTTQGGGTQSSSEASGADGLKLGALLPITGDLSSIGQNMPAAAKLAVETINACGGVNGKPVTLVSEDDQTDPTAGASAMTKLAESDRVAGVVGSFASSVSGAAVDIAVRNKVMLISPGSTSPVFTERAQKGEFQGYWARTAPPDTYQAQALALLANKKGFKNVSTIVINNDYGVGFEKEFMQSFEKKGGKLLTKINPFVTTPKQLPLIVKWLLLLQVNPMLLLPFSTPRQEV